MPIRVSNLRLGVDEPESLLPARLARLLGLPPEAIQQWRILRKTLDARDRSALQFVYAAEVTLPEDEGRILQHARKQARPPAVFGVFSAEELGLALGLENVIHTAFLAGRAAERWTQDVHRLSGFCPLLPESWREEP